MLLILYNWTLILYIHLFFIDYVSQNTKARLSLPLYPLSSQTYRDGAVKHYGKKHQVALRESKHRSQTKLNSGLLWDLSCSHYCSLGTIQKPVTSTAKPTIQNQSNLKTFKCSFLQHSPLNMSGSCLTLQVKIISIIFTQWFLSHSLQSSVLLNSTERTGQTH